MPWFMEQIARGIFEVVNPFNQRVSIVPATADAVHTIVFWSKNFGPFIGEHYGDKLLELGYHLFFNFTVNSDIGRSRAECTVVERPIDSDAASG